MKENENLVGLYIPRFLERTLLKYLHSKEILAIVGPRQSGKTTLIEHLLKDLPNALFLNFEDRETLRLFEEDLPSFIELHIKKYKYVFIDEFQYAKKGGKNLKFIYDQYNTKIILSGSSVSELSIQSLQYLVGRVFIFQLYPFSFEEFLSYKSPQLYSILTSGHLSESIIEKIFPFFQEFCLFGGYPRVILAQDKEEKEMVLRNIYNTYFLKEVKEILQLPEDYKLGRFLSALSIQISGLMNYQELSGISGFKQRELLKYLNILEKTFLIIRSHAYHTNKRTELVKINKIFFLDNGFRNIVLKNFQSLEKRLDKGALYENFVASELLKKGEVIKYWRTKSKAEVDFVLEREGKIIPLEVKSNLTSLQISRSLHSFVEKYSPPQSFILSEKFWAEERGVFFRPIFWVGRI